MTLIDTAGLRATDDLVEAEGVRRSIQRIEDAGIVVLVLDGSEPNHPDDGGLFDLAPSQTSMVVISKSDLPIRLDLEVIRSQAAGLAMFTVSVVTGEGFPDFIAALTARVPLRQPILGATSDDTEHPASRSPGASRRSPGHCRRAGALRRRVPRPHRARTPCRVGRSGRNYRPDRDRRDSRAHFQPLLCRQVDRTLDKSQRELLVAGAADLGVVLDDPRWSASPTTWRLLQQWGKKINLTTRLETSEVIPYHFLDSLAGVPDPRGVPTARVVDLGAGAGLPSFPLKFALPGFRFLLVESVRKKVAFCQEAIRATGVTEIEAMWGRGEDLGARPDRRQSYDWAVSRALGSSVDVARLALPFLAPGGRILLYKGEPESEELQALDAFCTQNSGSWEQRRVSIPGLKAARSLIIVTFP